MAVKTIVRTTTRTGAYANPNIDFAGAEVRVHYRHLATVVTVRGEIDAANVDAITEHVRRFVLGGEPLVIDVSGVRQFNAAGLWMLCVLAGDCQAAGLEWTLVGNPAIDEVLRDFDEDTQLPMSPSVEQALHALAVGLDLRRELLLPLLKKTA